jgi:hypothetical protein
MSFMLLSSLTWRVKPEGKPSIEKKVDLENPLKTLEELEDKAGVKCSENRKKQLLEQLRCESMNGVNWIQGVTVPDWYTTAIASDVTNALQWGSEMVINQKNSRDGLVQSTLNLEWKNRCDSKDQEYKQQIAKLKEDFQYQLSQKDIVMADLRKQASDNMSSSNFDMKVQNMSQQLEAHYKSLMDNKERELHTYQNLSDNQLKRLENDKNKIELERQTLQRKLEDEMQRNSMLNKSGNKGEQGQDFVMSWLDSAFNGAIKEATSTEGDEMDIHLTCYDQTKIKIDVKNNGTSRGLAADHVNKFHRNLLSSTDSNIGILLCTRTYVPHHNSSWVETEIMDGNKLAIYMNRVSENPIDRLQIVVCIINTWKEYLKIYQSKSDLLEQDKFKEWEDKARTVLNNSWSSIKTLKECWTKTQSTINESLDTFQIQIDEVIEKMGEQLLTVGIEVDHSQDKKKKSTSRRLNLKSTAKSTSPLNT